MKFRIKAEFVGVEVDEFDHSFVVFNQGGFGDLKFALNEDEVKELGHVAMGSNFQLLIEEEDASSKTTNELLSRVKQLRHIRPSVAGAFVQHDGATTAALCQALLTETEINRGLEEELTKALMNCPPPLIVAGDYKALEGAKRILQALSLPDEDGAVDEALELIAGYQADSMDLGDIRRALEGKNGVGNNNEALAVQRLVQAVER